MLYHIDKSKQPMRIPYRILNLALKVSQYSFSTEKRYLFFKLTHAIFLQYTICRPSLRIFFGSCDKQIGTRFVHKTKLTKIILNQIRFFFSTLQPALFIRFEF